MAPSGDGYAVSDPPLGS